MLSGTQYMLQKNPGTRLPSLTFGMSTAGTVIAESESGTLSGQGCSRKEVQIRRGHTHTHRHTPTPFNAV